MPLKSIDPDLRSTFARLGMASVLLLAAIPAGGLAGEEIRAQRLTEILPYSELLARAETIAVCEVRSTHAGAARLRVIEWLKGPPEDARAKFEERRAASRLAQEASEKLGGTKDTPQAGEPEFDLGIDVIAPFEPPAAGTQNLYFLWERLDADKDLFLRYRIAHPQCVYEALHAAEVKNELSRARTAPRRRYLRDWDARMAARLLQQQQTASLLRLKPGHAEKGLRLTFRFAKASLLSPGSFDISFDIENLLDAEQAIYDGPLPVFGVRIQRKDAPNDQPLVLFATDSDDARVGADVLSLVDVNDFVGVPKKDKLIKTLHFEAKDHPALAKLTGEFVACAFYASTLDGKGIENLPGVPWVGTLVSDEGSLTFQAAAQP